MGPGQKGAHQLNVIKSNEDLSGPGARAHQNQGTGQYNATRRVGDNLRHGLRLQAESGRSDRR